MRNALNILDKRWLDDPAALVEALKKVEARGLKVSHEQHVTGYVIFSKMERCPNDAAEKYGRAAGIPEDRLQELIEKGAEVFKQIPRP